MAEVLALDLGGTKLLLARVNESGKVLEERKLSVNLSAGPTGLLRQISDAAKDLQSKETIALGLSSAGPLDPIRGTWLNPTNLKTQGAAWGEVPVVTTLTSALNLPCVLENDAACAAIAESWLGSGKGCPNFVTVTLGTGLGVGVWANGTLLRAGRHLHTELGHWMLNWEANAEPCGCGNRGCAEAYLSGTNFSQIVSRKVGKALSGEEILSLAERGDTQTLEMFAKYSDWLAVFIRNLVVSFYPEKVIFSGGFAPSGKFFLKGAEKNLALLMKERFEINFTPKLSVSDLGSRMGILGAAKVAFQACGRT